MSSLVPDGWSEEYISEYFDFSIGGTPSRNNELYWDANQTTSNIWVSIKDLKDKFISNSAERISDLGVSKSNVKLLPKNTVLMSFKLSIGRLAISTTPLYTNEAIVGFIEKRPNTVDRDYLYYGLQSWNLLGEVDQAVKGATLNKDKMSRILGVFPPLPEQKKIASILTSVDEVIENTQKQIDKLQDLKKATMNELLTKGIGHTEFKDSELGRIPKSWEVATLESVSSFRRGSFPQPYGNPEWYDDNGFPFVQVFDIAFNRRLKTSTKVKISKKAADMSVFIPAGSLLVSLQGSIGRVAVTQYDAYVDRTVLIFSKYESSLERFFFSIMIEELFRRQKDVADGGIIKTITKETLRSFEITVPPLSEQRKIGVTIQSIEGSISKHESKLAQTQSLKKSLMQDLLTGKVRVTVN